MAECRNCIQDYGLCGDCYEGSLYKGMNNANRIRNMSDEELAEFLANYRAEDIGNEWCLHLCPDRKDGDCDCPYLGYETALGWLKSNAKE